MANAHPMSLSTLEQLHRVQREQCEAVYQELRSFPAGVLGQVPRALLDELQQSVTVSEPNELIQPCRWGLRV